MEMKLINVLIEEYSEILLNGITLGNTIHTLDYKKLDTISDKLKKCEEFKNCELIITHFPVINYGNEVFQTQTLTINRNKETILGNGIFFLYQVNTLDFINFDIRGYFFEKEILDSSVREEVNMDYSDENITKERKELANELMDEQNFNDIMKARTISSTFIEDRNTLFIQEKDSYTDLVKDINAIEQTLQDCDGLDDDQIIALKDKIKNFENKLKDKVKPKTITISSSVHNKIKRYCQVLGLKIGDWVESSLLKSMDVSIDEKIVDSKIQDDMIKRYFESKKINKLLKSDKLIIMAKFKFKGYSHIDFKPVYDYIGSEKDFNEDMENITANITVIPNNMEIYMSSYLPEFADIPVEGLE